MTAAPRCGWSIERRVDTARALHGSWPEPGECRHRRVGLCAVVGPPTLVLGSTQKTEVVNLAHAARHGVDVVHRSSGGGAVLVAPDAQVWLDVWVPRQDPLWDDDVIRSSWWLGETWVRALEGLGASKPLVHRGPAARTEWSGVMCFAGIGPGEVTARGAKVVGIAQRRTRLGAHLHSTALVSWDPTSLLDLLSLDAQHLQLLESTPTVLDGAAMGIDDFVPTPPHHSDVPPTVAVIETVENALVAALP